MSLRTRVIEPGPARLAELGDYLIMRAYAGQKYGAVVMEITDTYGGKGRTITLESGEVERLYDELTKLLAESALVRLRENHDGKD